MMLVFFFTASQVMRVGETRKRALDPEFKEDEQRNWCLDVEESSLVTALIGGVIGHYACCNGDTWSSGLGILSEAESLIITTFKLLVIPLATTAGTVVPLKRWLE
ncbi:hypothetical protein GUJ93_ZPchr0001g32945 [Zizania palustris]|uniref:Uncharacterized protein n=1 Tax=Zizania palustris TaxID=103762 RepID=A0A8J5RGD8_ZIZPA|nr:hypothetical protein GUJ93_ZPchr0001g32945 [Zizania palustris]